MAAGPSATALDTGSGARPRARRHQPCERLAQPERAAPPPNVDNPRRPLAAAVARSGRRRVGQRGHVSHRAGSVGTAVAASDPPVPYPPRSGGVRVSQVGAKQPRFHWPILAKCPAMIEKCPAMTRECPRMTRAGPRRHGSDRRGAKSANRPSAHRSRSSTPSAASRSSASRASRRRRRSSGLNPTNRAASASLQRGPPSRGGGGVSRTVASLSKG